MACRRQEVQEIKVLGQGQWKGRLGLRASGIQPMHPCGSTTPKGCNCDPSVSQWGLGWDSATHWRMECR